MESEVYSQTIVTKTTAKNKVTYPYPSTTLAYAACFYRADDRKPVADWVGSNENLLSHTRQLRYAFHADLAASKFANRSLCCRAIVPAGHRSVQNDPTA